MAFVRLVIFGLLGLSVVYLSLSIYSRSVRKERLEKQYDAAPVDGVSRDDYVQKGITEYNASLRPKLLLLVYIVPIVLVGAIVYITNAN